MKPFILFSIISLLTVRFTNAQISPPGLGAANSASWFAFGVRQALDSAEKIQSVSYIGLGRTSDPVTNNPFQRKAIIVLNQEFYHKFHKHWHYSLAVSYRNQNEYLETSPYESASPPTKQEFRIYGRYMYELKMRNFRFIATYRQEFRSFFEPDFKQVDERYQLRSRFRLQTAVTLDKNKVHRIMASAEVLFSSTQTTDPETHWTTFGYKEARLCLYYSVDPKNSSLIYSIGYMNNLIGQTDITSVSYLAMDIIWENPFKHFKREMVKPIE